MSRWRGRSIGGPPSNRQSSSSLIVRSCRSRRDTATARPTASSTTAPTAAIPRHPEYGHVASSLLVRITALGPCVLLLRIRMSSTALGNPTAGLRRIVSRPVLRGRVVSGRSISRTLGLSTPNRVDPPGGAGHDRADNDPRCRRRFRAHARWGEPAAAPPLAGRSRPTAACGRFRYALSDEARIGSSPDPQPDPGGLPHPVQPLQEAPLADAGPHVLPTASPAPTSTPANSSSSSTWWPSAWRRSAVSAIADPRHILERDDRHRPATPTTARSPPCSPDCSRPTRAIITNVHAGGWTATANTRDDGTNDLLMGDVLRRHETQVWFVAEHLVDTPADTRLSAGQAEPGLRPRGREREA